MPKSDVSALTLLAVLIADALVANVPTLGVLSLFSAIVPLIVLFAYDREGVRSIGQSVAFGAVCAFCVIPAADMAFQLLGVYQRTGPLALAPGLIWLVGTLIFTFIDRSRMGGNRGAIAPQSFQNLSPTQGPVLTRAPLAPEPAISSAVPEPWTTPSPVPPIPATVRPVGPTSLFSQPVVSSFEAPIAPAESPAPPPNAVALPLGAGKPAVIYLNLVGEGLACLRSVQAEHLGKDYYRIVEPVPPGESWEFQPGQVVRCQKRSLSSGKAMVAVEEAPRAK